MLKTLQIIQFRGLHEVVFDLSAPITLFMGPNGTGKTSALEAIHVLLTGTSFKTSLLDNCQNWAQPDPLLAVRGEIVEPSERIVQLSVTKYPKQPLKQRIMGERVRKRAEVVELLPLQILHPGLHHILQGSNKGRMALLDWSCFYSNDHFFNYWQQCQRLLKQRNALLKLSRSALDFSVWDPLLIELTQQLTEIRQACARELIDALLDLCAEWFPQYQLAFEFYPGWKGESGYAQALEQAWEKDRRYQYTNYGPHRADLLVYMHQFGGQRLASLLLSHGEALRLILAIKLAQGRLLRQKYCKMVTYLLDEVMESLDRSVARAFFDNLIQERVQVITTQLNSSVSTFEWCKSDCQVFHFTP